MGPTRSRLHGCALGTAFGAGTGRLDDLPAGSTRELIAPTSSTDAGGRLVRMLDRRDRPIERLPRSHSTAGAGSGGDLSKSTLWSSGVFKHWGAAIE